MKRITFPGDKLQERRLELGLSLKDVHDQIHVPLQHIEALERGDVAALPQAAYVTGFITSYCELLGVYPQPYLDRYRTVLEDVPAPMRRTVQSGPTVSSFALPTLPRQRPAWIADAMAWGTICGIVLLGWITYSVVFKPAAPDESRVDAGTPEITVPEYHFLEDDLAASPAE